MDIITGIPPFMQLHVWTGQLTAQINYQSIYTHLLGLFLELLDGTLVNATALVDQVTCGGRFARVHMANNHDVDVNFFLAHVESLMLGAEINKSSPQIVSAVLITFPLNVFEGVSRVKRPHFYPPWV